MTPPRIAVFCMPEPGHFQLLRPLIGGLVRHGAVVEVYTARSFEAHVERAGATFVDLFGTYPLELADDTSTPIPCRYVSYAGKYVHTLVQQMTDDPPSMIIGETFALIGRVAAGLLEVPWINVSPGHALIPARFLARLHADPRVSISAECHRAVRVLQEEFGLPDASPFSFVTSLSSVFNICCEPPGFLDDAERQIFHPVAHFGSLPSPGDAGGGSQSTPQFGNSRALKVYISFGSVAWRYFRSEAFTALCVAARYFRTRPDIETLISLGDATLGEDQRAQLESTTVRVASFVDQSTVLGEADVFVTHHGINSTHEAIDRCVPMLSYPFFWDQPDLAARCQRMGIAVPLGDTLRGTLSDGDIHHAMARLHEDGPAMHERLERARNEERKVIEGRDAIIQKLFRIAG